MESEVNTVVMNDYPRRLIRYFAQNLHEPSCTDVEFQFLNSGAGDDDDRKLYAMSHLLMDKSMYFKRSIFSLGVDC
jgi:hypothetical protein